MSFLFYVHTVKHNRARSASHLRRRRQPWYCNSFIRIGRANCTHYIKHENVVIHCNVLMCRNGSIKTINKKKMSDLLNAQNTMIDMEALNRLLGFVIPEEKYNNIRRCINDLSGAIVRPIAPNSCTELTTFCNRFKRGSKPFRRILDGPAREEIPRNIQTFAAGTDTIIGLEMGRIINGLWGFSFFFNNMRVFLFKLHNNILGLNNRVAHFIRDHSPICTFCRLMRRNDAQDESVLHLFYECEYVERVRDAFFQWAYDEDVPFVISRQDLFLIQTRQGLTNGTTLIRTVIAKLYLKYIWDCRNRNCLPELEGIKNHIAYEINTIVLLSVKMREFLNDSGLARIFLQG
jgi:hypothetical protein